MDNQMLVNQIIEVIKFEIDDLRGELKSDFNNLKVDNTRDHEKIWQRMEKNHTEIKDNFVTKDAFDPVQKLVWAAMLGLLATTIGIIFK